MNRAEQQFYEQFSQFSRDFKDGLKLQKSALELQERQNELLIALYLHFVKQDGTDAPPKSPVATGVLEIDRILDKQKKKLEKKS